MDEMISKLAAIDALGEAPEVWMDTPEEFAALNQWEYDVAAIKAVPSIQPKTGRWIKAPEFCGDDVSGFIDNHFTCSECKKEAEINPWGFYVLSDFCPNCGAKMYKENSE